MLACSHVFFFSAEDFWPPKFATCRPKTCPKLQVGGQIIKVNFGHCISITSLHDNKFYKKTAIPETIGIHIINLHVTTLSLFDLTDCFCHFLKLCHHLQMYRQDSLLSYLKTLSVGLVQVWTQDLLYSKTQPIKPAI